MKAGIQLNRVGINLALLMAFLPLSSGQGRDEVGQNIPNEKSSASAISGYEEELSVDFGGGVTMDLLLIGPGSFKMGSTDGHTDEEPVHEVALSKAFYMGKYEVTQEQWEVVMNSNPSRYKDPEKPVENVSWNDCLEFIEVLNQRVLGLNARLPTEAEWEYACRAGTTTRFGFGDSETSLGEHAWFMDNAEKTTHPVGEMKPNAFGLHDMHGNVWEWCDDPWHASYNGAPVDGSARLDGVEKLRVLRGGSWRSNPRVCRSANRFFDLRDDGENDGGFRVVALSAAAHGAFMARRGGEDPEMVSIGLRKQLLVDSFAIEQLENLTFELGEVTKANDGRPLFVADKPWEKKSFGGYATVIHEDGRYRMWYNILSQAYAESEDGLQWNKPNLGLVEYEGSVENNIVSLEMGHGLSVFKDPHETDPEHRYKMAYTGKRVRAALGYSEDGLHWKKYNDGNGVTGRAADTYNQLLWDEDANVYRLYTRTDYKNKLGAEIEVRGNRGMVNPDVKSDPTNWTTIRNWLFDREGTEEYRRRQIYAMTDWIYEGIHFALMNVYEWPQDLSGGDFDSHKRHERDTINFYIATSRDGDSWNLDWVYLGKPVIPRGPDGSFDKDMLFSFSSILTIGDQHWLYYTGYGERHSMSPRDPGIGLARMPLDRFVCLQAKDEPGVMITRPFELAGDQLLVNVEAPEGDISVEILNREGEPIPGFTREDAPPFQGVDELRLSVSWQEKKDLGSLKGRVIRLKFYLREARLYAFQIQENTIDQ